MIPGVLVIVHEQLGRIPVLAPPGSRDVIGRPPLHLAGERKCSPPQFREPPAGLNPDVDVQAIAAGGLRPPDGTKLCQQVAGN